MKPVQLTEAAVRNHEEFFPNHASRLQQTDPEFIELFDNWAFDEVLRTTKLEAKTRVMLILAATIATQAVGEYRVMIGAGLSVGLTPVEIKEILYQSVSYVGIAKAFDFIHVTNDELQNGGVALPLEGQATTTAETRFPRGLATLKSIFGDEMIDRMRQQAPRDQQHIQDYLVTNCFGGYYTRGGIDLRTRELLTFAILISLGGCDPQVKAHVAGNLRIGNDRARLVDATTQLLPYIGFPRTLNALRAIDELTLPAVSADAAATSAPRQAQS